MKNSSNIGAAQIADQVGAQRQQYFLKKMGFLDPVAIELRERGRTLTPGSRWGPFETMTVGFGHGIAVTPLHLATGYATLFNGGIYRPATLLKVDRNHPVPPGRRVFSEETSYRMRALLRLVVTNGTGRKADAPGYRVGGKTGTAEKLLNGHYTSIGGGHELCGCVPDGRPALCDGDDAGRPQSRPPKPTASTRRRGTSARRSGWRSAVSRRCSECVRTRPVSRTCPRCSRSSTTSLTGSKFQCAFPSCRTSIAIPK